MWSFYKALLKNPRAIGAVTPSSPRLAHTLATFIPPGLTGLVVELGAGTGVITQAILNTGIPANRVIAIESSPYLAKTLTKRFPEVKVINKNACQLTTVLEGLSPDIDILISSLPLFSLPESSRQKIIHEIEALLKPNSYYIQYSYRKSLFDSNPRFKKIASKKVWFNFPPACIDVFKVQGADQAAHSQGL